MSKRRVAMFQVFRYFHTRARWLVADGGRQKKARNTRPIKDNVIDGPIVLDF